MALPGGLRACVYTCLMGDYEALNPQPVAATSGLDLLCFTDRPDLAGEGWRMIGVEGMFPLDPVRSHRLVKLSPHRLLADYDVSLYIDNSVVLARDPALILADWLGAEGLFALPGHSFRETIADEFMEVLRLGLDDGMRVVEQLHHYRITDPQVLDEAPYWAAMLARRHHHPRVIAAMELWQAHVLRFSRRDQLSANLAFRRAGLDVRRIELDNLGSELHRWPVTVGRDRAAFPFAPFSALVTPQMQARDHARSLRERADIAAALAGDSPAAAGIPPAAPAVVEDAAASAAATGAQAGATASPAAQRRPGILGRSFGRLRSWRAGPDPAGGGRP